MNIVIIDDDKSKLAVIESVVHTTLCDVAHTVKTAETLSEARELLRAFRCDVLFLDIKMPQSEGGDSRVSAGIDFISELHASPSFSLPTYLFVVSAFDEAHQHEGVSGTDGVYAWIRYDPLSGSWSDLLARKLSYIASVFESQLSDAAAFDYDLAVVCALEDVELDAVLALDWQWQGPSHPDKGDPTSYYFGRLTITSGRKIRVVAAAAPQMGMAAMAVLSTKIMSRFRPKYIAMPGIAAGVKKEKNINFGDVLVADLSWDYGSGKMKVESGKTTLAADLRPIPLDPKIKPLFSEIRKDKELLQKIAAESSDTKPKTELRVHIGPLASGAAVIADESIVADIVTQHRKLIGIEMEIYGLYYAAANITAPRPVAFALKSICDYGDRSKTDKYQAYAAYTSASVLDRLVRAKLHF
ncbi:response regulator [Burkholderia sp. 3C]